MKNKKLRLLVTQECPNSCPMCCNKNWDFSQLPIVDRWDYDEIMITGGEPLLEVDALIDLIDSIRAIHRVMDIQCKIYVYTAIATVRRVLPVLSRVDGIVFTPHNKVDVCSFIELNNVLLNDERAKSKSLRLNLFSDIPDIDFIKIQNLSLWKTKYMEWIEDCPVPEGEDFRRIARLW